MNRHCIGYIWKNMYEQDVYCLLKNINDEDKDEYLVTTIGFSKGEYNITQELLSKENDTYYPFLKKHQKYKFDNFALFLNDFAPIVERAKLQFQIYSDKKSLDILNRMLAIS
jgi:hypothetical protein